MTAMPRFIDPAGAQTQAPSGRIPLLAFVADAASEQAMQLFLADLKMPRDAVRRGGVAKAMQFLAANRSPAVLIVDISGIELPVSEVNRLAEACEPNVTVIAIGERNDVALYRDLMRAGVTDYIVKPLTRELIRNSYKNATGNVEREQISKKLGKPIVFIGTRGGVGTTTLAVNTAWHLAEKMGRRVALVDLDLQNGDCPLMLNVKPSSGLREALENPLRIDGVFLDRALSRYGERLFVLGSEEPLVDELRFKPNAIEHLLTALREQFHYIIIDLPRTPTDLAHRALDLAAARVVVSDLTMRSLRDTVRIQNGFNRQDGSQPSLLVINRLGERGRAEIRLKEFIGAVGGDVSLTVPFRPRECAAAANSGRPVASKSSALAGAAAQLAAELTGQQPKKRKGWFSWTR